MQRGMVGDDDDDLTGMQSNNLDRCDGNGEEDALNKSGRRMFEAIGTKVGNDSIGYREYGTSSSSSSCQSSISIQYNA